VDWKCQSYLFWEAGKDASSAMQVEVCAHVPPAVDATAQEQGRVVKRASRSNDYACLDLD
jgi:hypothetical protein